jgi:hypothetical protein
LYIKEWFKRIFPLFLTPKIDFAHPLFRYVPSLLTVPTTAVNGSHEQEQLTEKLTIKENLKDTNYYHLKARQV